MLIAAQADGDRIGRIWLRRIKDASGASLDAAVQEMIEPGSVVRTDDWQGYSNVQQLGYVRQIVYKTADVGVDHVTIKMFEEQLEENLKRLSEQLRKGEYRLQAIKRVLIPNLEPPRLAPWAYPRCATAWCRRRCAM